MTDLDVMPECAPEIIGRVKQGESWPQKKDRRWRARQDFSPQELDQHRANIQAKATGQHVQTFVADQWTLEYDLAYSGLARDVWIAAQLAKEDDAISAGKKRWKVALEAARAFSKLSRTAQTKEELASWVYAEFVKNSSLSKATTAQYLAGLLELQQRKGKLSPTVLRAKLPPYLLEAIEYVTVQVGGEAQEVAHCE